MLLPLLLQLQLLLLQPYAASARGREKSEGKEAAGATLSPGWRGGSSGESEKPSLEESLPSDFC